MELVAVQIKTLRAGEVVVYRGLQNAHQLSAGQQKGKYFYKLAIVVAVSKEEVVLSPFTALWDDDETTMPTGGGSQRIPKSIPAAEVNESLAKPVLELGDALNHRGRPARVSDTRPNDLHVSLKYEDAAGGDFYGNLIWMDVSPTLDLLRDRAAWPALP
ncbi:MAG: hypothetical protein RLZZ488_2384 [Pseudomonadota bacterium]|jgi:hypothetical protein